MKSYKTSEARIYHSKFSTPPLQSTYPRNDLLRELQSASLLVSQMWGIDIEDWGPGRVT